MKRNYEEEKRRGEERRKEKERKKDSTNRNLQHKQNGFTECVLVLPIAQKGGICGEGNRSKVSALSQLSQLRSLSAGG
jgi:hypothetical protein